MHPSLRGWQRTDGSALASLILTRWKPLFADVPVESLIHACQGEYYDAIRESSVEGESTPFIDYMPSAILAAILTPKKASK